MSHNLEDLRKSTRQILDSAKPELRQEIEHVGKDRPEWVGTAAEAMKRLTEIPEPPRREGAPPRVHETLAAQPARVSEAAAAPPFEYETIVHRVGRPVFKIKRGAARLEFEDNEAQIWRRDLEAASQKLSPIIPAVGRVEVTNHGMNLDYVGTAWLVDDAILVTNRHVASEFAERGSAGYVFHIGFDRKNPIGTRIDFIEEYGNTAELEFPIGDVLFIAPEGGPDVAFVRLRNPSARQLPRALTLAQDVAPARTVVATIGYPARDSRIPEQELMDRIYGTVYDKKRLAPGFVTGEELGSVLHDCTTLGGNSGSVIVALGTGEAVGLHFAGSFLRTNYAVPGHVVARLLRSAKESSYEIGPRQPAGPATSIASPAATATAAPIAAAQASLPFAISFQVGGVELGRISGTAAALPSAGMAASVASVPSAAPGSVSAPAAGRASVGVDELNRAVEYARRQLASRADVVSIKPGYRVRDGWITDERAVVVTVRQKLPTEALLARGITPVPTEFLGVQVDVTMAAPLDFAMLRESMSLEGPSKWVSNYQLRPNLPLRAFDEVMAVTVHSGPDSGWPTLQKFLQATQQGLTVGMYDFTAQHILDEVKGAVKRAPRAMKLVIQAGESLDGETKKEDLPDASVIGDLADALGPRFDWTYASVKGANRLFDSSYHIKVAVRDGKALWLSSGSWQSSNQPDCDPIGGSDQTPPVLRTHNREWHVVLEHKEIAKLYERYLELDLAEARAVPETTVEGIEPELWVPIDYFQPSASELEAPVRYFKPLALDRRVRVQPLLTPDNYAERVIELIHSATERVYFQNQSLAPLAQNAPHFDDLLGALLAKQEAGLDVRIIFREFPGTRDKLTALKDYGFDVGRDHVRVQRNCHTKGIVIDSQSVLVGSHNWTNAGTKFNRDASLIFYDPEIAQYFERLFLYDWRRIGGSRIDENVPAIEVVRPDDPRTRPGFVRMALSELSGR